MLLVTGGTGFLGRNFLEQTQEPCIFTGRDRTKGREIAEQTGHRFLPINLAKKWVGEVAEVGEISGIVHCAALSSPWGKYDDFYLHNVVVTRRLLEFAKNRGVKRFVHISTPSIYFDFKDRLAIPEFFRPEWSVNHYARTKLMAEYEVQQSGSSMHTTVLRPRGIFGKHDTTIFPRLLALGKGVGIPLVSDGNAVIDITHVDNVVFAIHQALKAQHRSGREYNITNNEPMRVIDLLAKLSEVLGTPMKTRNVPAALLGAVAVMMEALGHITGKEPPLTRYTASLLRYDQTLDIAQAMVELNYLPVRGILDGLKDYAL